MSDVKAAIAFLGEAGEIGGHEPFTTDLLDRLLQLLQCDFATYTELDLATGVVSAYVPCSAEGKTPDADVPWQLSDEDRDEIECSPELVHRLRAGDVRSVTKWSDSFDRRRRLRYGVHESYQRKWSVVDYACLSLNPSPVHLIWLTFHSRGRDFSERDRELLELMAPQLVADVRAARLRRQLAGLEAALDADDAPAIVVASREGEIDFASPEARRLLAAFFGDSDVRLPPALRRWMGDTRGATPFSVERDGSRLVVETIGRDGPLMLTKRAAAPLTAREREVMCCIAGGKSTAETARLLSITPATVSKHLEHVYRKLGVANRTAALAKLADVGD
jgi:DNA-binding CsgD family transcriptional regulator